MPIYEYDCQKCGTFEVTQKMSDPVLTTHEACGSPVEKKISISSFSLKGGGWYSEGYASTGKKASGSGDGPACGGGGCAGGMCSPSGAN